MVFGEKDEGCAVGWEKAGLLGALLARWQRTLLLGGREEFAAGWRGHIF